MSFWTSTVHDFAHSAFFGYLVQMTQKYLSGTDGRERGTTNSRTPEFGQICVYLAYPMMDEGSAH